MEAAVKHGNTEELNWALAWTRARIRTVVGSDHLKAWRKREEKILRKLAELS